MHLINNTQSLMGSKLFNPTRLHGGDLSEAWRAALPDGGDIVCKTGPSPKTEAAMLTAMAEAGAAVPDVIAANDDVLVITYCDNDGSLSRNWSGLGETLRTLHHAHHERFGWPEDYAFGVLKIANTWSDEWPQFWRDHRLACQLAHLPGPLAQRLEKLCQYLDELLPKAPKSSLLHGDLWGGNILSAGDGSCTLIDPACYYGDAEVDLAMLHVFDQPGAAFWEAYGDVRGTGFNQRQAIYQLWPALVHVRLFGSGYHAMVERYLSASGF